MIDEVSLPEWFTSNRPTGKIKLPAWLDPGALPAITLSGQKLTPEQLTSVLGVLKESTLATPGAPQESTLATPGAPQESEEEESDAQDVRVPPG